MLELKVYDRGNEVVLTFEHSLLSLSKWEAKTKKAFLSSREKDSEEMLDYYKTMLTSPEHDPDLVYRLSPDQMDRLAHYISDPMSADRLPDNPDAGRRTGEVSTSDHIYMQMVLLRIPFEAQTWHLNRLMMLIAKTADAQKPPEKKKQGHLLNTWQTINEKNREFFKSKG